MIRVPEVFEWPERELGENSNFYENEALLQVISHYKKISELMVAEQGENLDKFYDHFLARIGRSLIDEPVMAFTHANKDYLVRLSLLLPFFSKGSHKRVSIKR